jgi:UDP-glucose 4-epimerase
MNTLVTGAAGFIGSHLCRKLIEEGSHILAVDSFTDFYPRWLKEKNIQSLVKHPRFELLPQDLLDLDLEDLLKKIDVVYHLAAQPGVRTSWGSDFSVYTINNIDITQRLLEAAKKSSIKKFIYASSSSVYGLSPQLPMSESNTLRPFSPYGVTKLAAENLCTLYHANYGIPCVSLRFFTVYGPGQRPDMAFHRFFSAMARNKEIVIFGDGQQTRDFTFVDDIVRANLASIKSGKPGEIYNLGGGSQKKLADILPLLQKISQTDAKIRYVEREKGDVLHTFADIRKAERDLNYSPQVALEDGLKLEWDWIRTIIEKE